MARRKKPAEPPAPKPSPEKLNRPFAGALTKLKEELAEAAKAEAEKPKTPAKAVKPAPAAPKPVQRSAPARPAAPRPGDPIAQYGYEDRVAFHQAFADVAPMKPKRPGKKDAGAEAPVGTAEERARALAELRAAEDAARARLDALVAGAVRFEVHRDHEGEVVGFRAEAGEGAVRPLENVRAAPHATLDLHGKLGPEAEREVARFVRERQRRGDRMLLIVHGRGLHSDGAIGVLGDHVVRALTAGGSAPLVLAFRSAPARLGGVGALLVRLSER